MNDQPIDFQTLESWLRSDSAGEVYQIIKTLLNESVVVGDVLELSAFKRQTARPTRMRYVHFHHYQSPADLKQLSCSENSVKYDVLHFCLMWQCIEQEQQVGLLNMLSDCTSEKAECHFFLFNPKFIKMTEGANDFSWLKKKNAVDFAQMEAVLKAQGFEYIEYRSVYPKLTRFSSIYQKLLNVAGVKTPGFAKLAGPIIEISAKKMKAKMIHLLADKKKKAKRSSQVMNLTKEESH